MKAKLKVNVLRPRQLSKQNAWYYLPSEGEHCIDLHQEPNIRICLPAKKLYRELKAIYEK